MVNIYTKSGPPARSGNREMPERFFGFGPLPFEMPELKREALGSGFVINAEEGYIVTNAHVVRQAGQAADEIMVKFIGEEEDGKGHPAKVIGADEITDVALLKLTEKRKDLKAAVFGDSSLSRPGEWVLAIGNPYGHTHTVTQGIVSAVGRNLEGARGEFLQTSAGINPGNSGGPLINMNGEVIGINSAIDPRAPNIGFAIPSNTAKDVIAQLAENGRVQRAWMGAMIDNINEEVAGLMHLESKNGVLVKQVMTNAPAHKAGIRKFDVIRKIDGAEINNTRDLFRSMAKLSAGKQTEIQILRGGTPKTMKVELTEQPANS